MTGIWLPDNILAYQKGLCSTESELFPRKHNTSVMKSIRLLFDSSGIWFQSTQYWKLIFLSAS
jgi:hypothetical protein